MPDRDESFKQAISDVANALQVAQPIAIRQRRELGDLAQDAVNLEAAVNRAVDAVRLMQPQRRNETGDYPEGGE